MEHEFSCNSHLGGFCERLTSCYKCGTRVRRNLGVLRGGFDLFCGPCCERVFGFTSHSWYSSEIGFVQRNIQRAGDEWLANNARVEALSGVLPRPALEIVARELGVKYWELNN